MIISIILIISLIVNILLYVITRPDFTGWITIHDVDGIEYNVTKGYILEKIAEDKRKIDIKALGEE